MTSWRDKLEVGVNLDLTRGLIFFTSMLLWKQYEHISSYVLSALVEHFVLTKYLYVILSWERPHNRL